MTIHRHIVLILLLSASTASLAAGDASRGAQVFGACAGCHSLNVGDHRTGPSLANVYGRRAGTAEGFHRYSPALRSSGVVWNEKTLDAWMRDPAAFIPHSAMAFRGLPDERAREDLVAYLKEVSKAKAPVAAPRTPLLPDLKQVQRGQRVSAIRHCGDSYYVTLGNGETSSFWEFNLRFKTDSSARGPVKAHPVLVGAGMGGDRAQVVFANPAEMSTYIRNHCE